MGLAVATSVPTKTLRSDAVEEMAPALTEPLSQSKLSSSAASGASPRTSSSTTTTTTIDTTIASSDAAVAYEEERTTQSSDQQPQLAALDGGGGGLGPVEHHAIVTSLETQATSSFTEAQETATTSNEQPITGPSLVSTTVDDIQNNNSTNNGEHQALKILPETSRDLIELALEQLHQDATIGVGGGMPGLGNCTVTNAATTTGGVPTTTNITTTTSTSIPTNILQLPVSDQQPQQLQQEIMNVPAQELSQSSIGTTTGSETGGLQKDYLKENAEMDQMIHDLSTADIDLLQVLKSFDTSGLLLFSDVDVANLCDGPDGSGQSAASPNKDRERLELRADIIKRQTQMQRKCDFLIRRLSKLCARYMGQHISEEVAGTFEYAQRYWKKREKEYAKGQLHSAAAGPTTSSHATATGGGDGGQQQWPEIIPYQAPPPLVEQQPEKLKPISANALKTFTKRLEGISSTICSAQSKRVLHTRYFHGVNNASGEMVGRGTAVGAGAGVGERPPSYANISNTIPLFEKGSALEMEQTAGLLHAGLRQVQMTLDSDATLSSSGGDSADESVPYSNMSQQTLPIRKRALWKWSKDRAAVASRWTWLVARVADLEYRIRQHNEWLMKIRFNKGPVTLEEFAMGQDSSGIGGDDGGAQQPQSINGYRGLLPGSSKPLNSELGATDEEEAIPSCSRTRPYNRSKFRKRKLMQTPNLHIISKRAARPSNIKCGCQWPLQPCALCTGRPDPTAPRDPPTTMPFAERVALLDSSYHPVLSFPGEISHSIHLEAIMRLPEMQNRMIRGTTASTKASAAGTSSATGAPFLSSGDEGELSSHGKRYIGSDGKRKHVSSNKYKNNERSSLPDGNNRSKKSKSRRDVIQPNSRKSSCCHHHATGDCGSRSGNGASGGPNGHQNNKQRSSKSRKSSHCLECTEGQLPDGAASTSRSKNSSPTPNHHRNERRNRTSYDIDNIVIPHSMAATSRVSLPQYKDIAIPKWRIVQDEEDAATEQIEAEGTAMQIGSPPRAHPRGSVSPSSTTTVTASETGGATLTSGDELLVDIKPVKVEPTHQQPPNGTKPTGAAGASSSMMLPFVVKKEDYGDTSLAGPSCVESQQQQLIVMPAQDEEDISEEAIHLKHDRALQEERKKFQTFLKFPWSRPRANRRTESRAGSQSGPNTPDPTSPAPPTPMVEHDSSPTCPSTPLTPQDGQVLSEANVINAFNNSLSKKERRRTVSSKREEQQQAHTGGGNTPPDTRELVSPYESLQFPLTDDIYDEMLKSMPSDHIALVEECIGKLTGRDGLPLRRPRHPNNNVLLVLKSSIDLAPASLGLGSQNPFSSNASCTSTTMSAVETDLDDFDDEDLMLAKRTENQRIMERLLNSRDASQRYEIVPPTEKPMLDDDDPLDDEETDTGESLFVEEDDPNDPEWYDRPRAPNRSIGSVPGSGRL
ncbi:uncharacterized protein LOC131207059 [Anopheles bellator]|uniref:uncharacterized protein LOC131207059 n=1 Tax=Anopheles bellator TaxID=139047 RepID=UPI00264A1CD4|nr:uncharacterized protein LOC131207059 [Anopheles bellator]